MKNIITILCVVLAFGCSEDSVSPTSSESSASQSSGGTTGTGGSLARFTIAKNHLYVATESQLFTYSLENASDPQFQNSIQLGNGVETIFSLGDYIYLGTQNGMLIYDITNASSPQYTSAYFHVTSCDPVVANENYAYVTLRDGQPCRNGQNRLDVIDISNKRFPVEVNSLQMENPIGLGLNGNQLYVCDNGKIKQFDVSNPTSPLVIRETELIGVFDVIVANNRLIAVHPNGVNQYSIANNGALTLLSTIEKD
ncbi:hypothetical protein N9811_01730 [Bacteroidia bacterium]|nr:hypothetical protein [Bacteroidia bacterium]